MGAELGATTSMFPSDERMAMYLRATGRGDLVPLAERYPHLLAPDQEVEANPAKYYERVVKLDLSTLEPYVVGPHSPDRARPIGKLAAEVADSKNAFLDKISTTLIGSCTPRSYGSEVSATSISSKVSTGSGWLPVGNLPEVAGELLDIARWKEENSGPE